MSRSVMSGIDASNLRHWAPSSTGVLPVLTTCFGPRTAAAGLFGTTWPITSQSNSMRIAASCCLTDVATYIEELQLEVSAPSVKQQLAAIRMLFDWLVIGQVVPNNPAAAVRGPKHVVKTGKTPVLEGAQWRKLLASIPDMTLRDLRDRALIATLTYSFARIGAALNMKVEDLRPRGAGWSNRLHEKGGKQHTMPCHHALAEALRAYIDAAGLAEDRKGWLFRTSRGHGGTSLSEKPMGQPDAWRMIRKRAAAAGIAEEIGCHTFRATGITAYLANGGALEHAQEMAAHESPRTTKLYDRTKERLTQDEVERIRL